MKTKKMHEVMAHQSQALKTIIKFNDNEQNQKMRL